MHESVIVLHATGLRAVEYSHLLIDNWSVRFARNPHSSFAECGIDSK